MQVVVIVILYGYVYMNMLNKGKKEMK